MPRMEQNLYEILLRNLKEAVIFADEQGRIRIFNPVAEKYFQIERREGPWEEMEAGHSLPEYPKTVRSRL